MFKPGEKVKFPQVGCNTGVVISASSEETLVRFDDGDTCPVSTDFLQSAA